MAKPSEYVANIISDDEKDETDYETNRKKEGVELYLRPPTAITKAYRYYYGETNGSDLNAIIQRADVNPLLTYSNNIHEVYAQLGIEATRNFMIQELWNLLTYESSSLDPRHVVTIVDMQVNQGRPLPLTFTGLSKQNAETMALASFAQPVDVFTNASLMGTEDTVRSTSTSIALGKRATLGSGYMEVLHSAEKQAEIELANRKYQESLKKITNAGGTLPQADALETELIINQLDSVVSGSLRPPPKSLPSLNRTIRQPVQLPMVTTQPPPSGVEVPIHGAPIVSQLLTDIRDTLTIGSEVATPLEPEVDYTAEQVPIPGPLNSTTGRNTVPISPTVAQPVSLPPIPSVKSLNVGLPPSIRNLLGPARAKGPALVLPPAQIAPLIARPKIEELPVVQTGVGSLLKRRTAKK